MGKYALFIVSALIFSLLTYSSALRNALFMSNTRTIESHSVNQAYNIAQSAALIVVKDLYNNNDDSSFYPEEDETYSYPSPTGFQNWSEMKGSYNIKTTNHGDSLVVVQTTGRFDEGNYMVTVGLNASGGTVWMPQLDQAIHADNSIDMGNGTVFGDISINNTESNLSTGPQGTIEGDYYFYDPDLPSGEVEDDDGNGGDSGVQGDNYNMDEEINYPDPVFPDFPTPIYEGEDYSGSGTLYTSDISGKYFKSFSTNNTTIDLGGTDELILHAKNIDLSGNLNIVGDGTLKIYVESGLNLGNGDINADRSSKHLGLFYEGPSDIEYTGNGTFSGLLFAGNNETNITIGGNPNFTGHIVSFGNEITLHGTPTASSLIYAPNATVSLLGTGKPGSDFRGAIVSEDFTSNGKASVIYDEDFADNLPELEGGGKVTFAVNYWN